MAGIWIVVRRVHVYQGDPVHPSTGLLVAVAVATLVTGFVAGFAYLIVFGAMTREERDRGEAGLHGTVGPGRDGDDPAEDRPRPPKD